MLNKKTNAAFLPKDNFCGKVVKAALGIRLNLLGNLGHTGEYQVDYVLVCPAFTTTDAELEKIVSLLKAAILTAGQSFAVGGNLVKAQWQGQYD